MIINISSQKILAKDTKPGHIYKKGSCYYLIFEHCQKITSNVPNYIHAINLGDDLKIKTDFCCGALLGPIEELIYIGEACISSV